MKLTCPACGALFSLDVLLGNEGAREAVIVALQLPASLGRTLIQYIALFRPAKRNLSFERVAKLLGELQPLIAAAKIERNGTVWPAPVGHWDSAIGEVLRQRDLQKLRLPLTSHGYLFEVLAGLADKAAAQQERNEEKRAKGHTPVGYVPPAAAPPPTPSQKPAERARMPAAISEELNRLKTTFSGRRPAGEDDATHE